MNPRQLIKMSNAIGIVSIVLLAYWVFTFITIEVFGLKVFRENLTEIFDLSVLGILALMVGALIINIMFNLTRIARKHNDDDYIKSSKRPLWMLLSVFPVILFLLFGGDYVTSEKKEKLLVETAVSMVENTQSDHLVNYRFTKEWIRKTSEILEILSKTDAGFPYVSIVVKDTIADVPVYLGFRPRNYYLETDSLPVGKKRDYIQSTTAEERAFVDQVFDKGTTSYRYSSHDGKYELFYPYSKGGQQIIIYFSAYRQYGKIGS